LQLAVSLAQPEIERQGLALLSPAQAEALVEETWHEVEAELPSRIRDYFGNGPQAMYTLAETIQELRRAGLDSTNLDVTQFVHKDRGRVLHQILEGYERTLRARQGADPMSVLVMAQNRLVGEGALPNGQLLLVPHEAEYSGLLQSVLDQVPEADRVNLPASAEALPLFSTYERDITRLRWLRQPKNAPPPAHDGSVKILRALAPEYEVRTVLGSLLKEGVPFDQAEVVYTDQDLYPWLYFETLSAFTPSSGVLPCTWGGGVPVAWTRPARALQLWLGWVAADYRAKELIELIVRDLLVVPDVDHATGPADLTRILRLLRAMQGCLGRDTWRQRIAAMVKNAPLDVTAWLTFQSLTEPLFALLPATPLTALDMWSAAEHFLSRFAACRDARDTAAREQALQLINALRPHSKASPEAVVDRLLMWVDEERLPAEAPQPGKLHLAPIETGGQTGRPWAFIVGMNEDAFPGPIERRSFLTDRDRRQLSPELARTTRPELVEQHERRFQHLLDSLTGQVILTYPCADQVEDCEVFPSQHLIKIFQLLAQQPEGDLTDFERWLPPPLGPLSVETKLHIQDSWVRTWPIKGLYDPTLKQRFPNLPRGAFAAKERRQVVFTKYDGHVPKAGELFEVAPSSPALLPQGERRGLGGRGSCRAVNGDNDCMDAAQQELRPPQTQGPVFSAQALQRLARCPLQFFYGHVLGLTEPGRVEVGEWLNPLLRGVVLHNVFRDYHEFLQRYKRKANPTKDAFIIRQTLDRELQKQADHLPVVPEHVRQLEVNELQEVLMMFVSEEAKLADEYEPVYFEASLGLASDPTHRTALDSEQPIALRLPSGRTLYVHGRIDRVDRVKSEAAPHYFVWDYKTGGIGNFMGEEARRSGQVLQPLLYLEMLEQRLRSLVDPEAKVTGVGYFFPGGRGQGDRLYWTAEQLREHARALDLLVDVLQAGTFLATERRDICAMCGYQAACEVSQVNDQARFKRTCAKNHDLQPLRMLRDPATRVEVDDVG
jgi:ATP-dependent helicase/nuclease subunit B